MMKRYISLMCGAALLAALAAGCSGSFGFDGKDVPDGGPGTGTGGGSGNGGTGTGDNSEDNPFKDSIWENSNGYKLVFDENTCEITKDTAKVASIAREATSVSVITGSYSYTCTVEYVSFTATLKYSSGEVYATFTITASSATTGRLAIGNIGYTFEKKSGGTETGTEKPGSFTIYSDGRLVAYTGTEANITIPDTVKYINNAVFKDNKSLTSVTIPDGVITIGNDVFSGCRNLRRITLPASVESIGSNAFSISEGATVNYEGTKDDWAYILPYYYQQNVLTARNGTGLCYGNVTVKVDGVSIDASNNHWKTNEAGMNIEGYTGTRTVVKIPEGATGINDRAFKNNTQITEVTIPNTVTRIGISAFEDSRLTSVTIHNDGKNGVSTIDTGAFRRCTQLKSVTIPDSVISIGESAFSGCTELTSVTISERSGTYLTGLTEIPNSCFYGCEKLESVEIPSTVKSIGEYAFESCTNLKTVKYGGRQEQLKLTKAGSGLKGKTITGKDSDGNETTWTVE